jgi:type II secretion system protein H
MVSPAEPEPMRTLATGNKSNSFSAEVRGQELSTLSCQGVARIKNSSEAGFTLIELLIAVAVLAIVMAVAVLAIPNHDDRYWRDNLDQLVSSLNLAQEESAMSGMTMVAQIDSNGWRFFVPGTTGAAGSSAGAMTLGAGNAATNAPPPNFSNSSGLMPDVYQAKNWNKPVDMAPLQLTLGGEQVTEVLQIPIRQTTGAEIRQAILIRNRNGRFSWNKS